MQAIIHAIVKFPVAKIFTGQYGPNCNILVTLPDQSEQKIWGKPDELQSYRRGDAICLLQDAKGKLKPVAIEQAPMPAPMVPTAKPELDKKSIAEHVVNMARLYSYCYQQARSSMPSDAPDAAIQAAASSVFIATSRKYSL